MDNQYPSHFFEAGEDYLAMADGSTAVSLETMNALPSKDIITFRKKDLQGLAGVGIILMGLLFFSFGLNYCQFYLLEYMGQNIMQDIRLQLFQKIQSRAIRFFDRHPVGRLVTRVTNDIENINEMFKSVIVTVFKDILLLMGIVTVLLYLNWRLALVSFIILPAIFGVTFIFSSLAREAFRELRATIAKINAFLHERFSGMRIIQLYAREKYQMEHFKSINHENYLAGMKQIKIFAIFMPVIELFSSFAIALIIWHGGIKAIGDQLSLGALVAFISYIRMFFQPVRDISEKYNIMQLAMASIERVFEFLDHGDMILEPATLQKPLNSNGHLLFKDVSFAYDEDQPVLHNISFEIQPGEMVAVVGPTGAGKTTLVNLIERFYDPDAGHIFLDGIDIRKRSKKDLRKKIGLVMQDVFLFSGRLYDNIALGRHDIGMEAVERSVRMVNAHGFIQTLPNGLSQEIGEGGATLSVGERQLLSFARALAHQPDLLILDEATSSIDPETERLIQEAIYRMTRKRTTLVVAHRLSTIRSANRILVMHHGRIREQGTHDELIALKGIYYKLNKFREFHKKE